MAYKTVKIFSFISILMFLLSSCSLPINGIDSATSKTLPQAEVVFQVTLPEKTEENSSLYLEILDEVTGIYFNPQRFEMGQNSDVVYIYRIPLTIGAEINYRYIKIKDSAVTEFNSRNLPVLFRRLIVNGPVLVQDSIVGWGDKPFSGDIGRIRGQLIDKSNNAPIPDTIICAAGLQTTSSSDGTFILENVPVGTQNVVIFNREALYEPFQQYATISKEATTPIFLSLNKRELVKVTFNLSNVTTINQDLPVRMAGNISQLGNQFSLLNAGTANNSDHLPQMSRTGKGKYSITMSLPAGAFIKYKYTLGDGFWNSELDTNGGFNLREIIVPGKKISINNKITTFQSPGTGPIIIQATLPSETPDSETPYIQLNPYDWMEPIRMVNTGPDTWEYPIYSPLLLIGNTSVRFCRNGDCQKGLSSGDVISFSPSPEGKTITTNVEKWQDFAPGNFSSPAIDAGNQQIPINPNLITGVEIFKYTPSTWESGIKDKLADVKKLGSKWVVLSPSWSVSSISPPMIEPMDKASLSWDEEQKLITYVKLAGMEAVLFPQLSISNSYQFWSSPSGYDGWWQTFYDRYERFIVNYADLAQIMGVKAIILGDPTVNPSMVSTPDSEKRWSQLISEVRARYSGTIIGAFSIPSDVTPLPWFKDVDIVYAMFSPTISDQNNLINVLSSQLDSSIYPIYSQFGKPIILGVNIASNEKAINGCTDKNGSCAYSSIQGNTPDSNLQSKMYNAIVVSAFSKEWITGLISRGYYPFVMTTDQSASIYGKPTYDVLWFWYHYVLDLPS